MNPAMEVIEVAMNQQLMAGSPGLGGGEFGGGTPEGRVDEVFDMFEDNFSE